MRLYLTKKRLEILKHFDLLTLRELRTMNVILNNLHYYDRMGRTDAVIYFDFLEEDLKGRIAYVEEEKVRSLQTENSCEQETVQQPGSDL